MAFHNTNYEAVPMPAGTYNADVLGNGMTASTVHEVFCTTDGTVTITARGGGKFTWAATAGQTVKVMPSQVIVSSGEFVGFRAQLPAGWNRQARIQ
jgi:hypothetical protein